MNVLDIMLIIILIGCIINGYYKGFFKEVFDIISFILGIITFTIIYPVINKWLLQSPFLQKVKDWVIYDFNLAEFTATTQEDIIQGIQNLNLPQMIKNLLIENNNEVFYKIFNVDNTVDYIAKFIAIVIISLVALFIVVILVGIITALAFKSIKSLSKMPYLSKFDKIGGIGCGILNGIFTIWIIGIIILLLSSFPALAFLKEQLDGFLTGSLINNNILLKALLNLILGIIS